MFCLSVLVRVKPVTSQRLRLLIKHKDFTVAFRGFVLKSTNFSDVKLSEVGRLDEPKLAGKYETGQLFLHRVFGYRGVVLFPWIAKVYDRDLSKASSNSNTNANMDFTSSVTEIPFETPETASESPTTDLSSSSPSNSRKESSYSSDAFLGQAMKDNIKGSAHTYYQVLIDSRDCQYLKNIKKAQTEAVTFLGSQDSGRTLYAVPGLDYVAHEDILPFTTVDQRPIHHELFHKFLMRVPNKDPPFEARDTLAAWQHRNHPWLELSDVHRETTEGIRVTVIPFYMGCREAYRTMKSDVYWWRYCIRLENLTENAVQLRERHWRIFSLSGTLETVRGRGVVGSEPVLTKQDPAFQYSSHVSLPSPSGHMWGTFRMEREDGYIFECRIPPFSLESKQVSGPMPPVPGPEL